MPPVRTKRSERRGTTIVEMAIVGSLLFLLVTTAVDLGRLYVMRQSASSAAYEAARVGLTPGVTAKEVMATAEKELASVRVRGALVKVFPTSLKWSNSSITVVVDIPMNQNCIFLRANRWISTACTLRTLRQSG